MSRYFSEEAAAADGFTFEYREAESRFVLLQGDEVKGYAKYTLYGDRGIDFDGTVVDPSLRGTGLSQLLVTRAVGHDIARGRSVRGSCWYVAGFLERHPDRLAEGATFQG